MSRLEPESLRAQPATEVQSDRLVLLDPADIARAYLRSRTFLSITLMLIAILLVVVWDWGAGWVVVGLASVSLVDASIRLRKPGRMRIGLPILVDITATGAAMILAGLPDIVVVAPFAYQLTSAVLLLRRAASLWMLAYLAAWSLVILTVDSGLAETLDPSRQEVVAAISVVVYLGAMFLMTSTAAGAVRQRQVLGAELRANTARLKAVLDSTPIVLFALDLDSRFTLSEGPGLAQLGLEPGEVVGLGVEEVYGEVPEVLSLIGQATASDEDVSGEVLVNGVSFAVHLWPQYDSAERRIGIVGVASDVTDEVRYRMELEGLVRSKDEFVASVSHELRTPLTVVYGLGEELREKADEFTPEEMSELHELVAQQAGEASAIVEDLLVAARADIDRVVVIPQRVNVHDEITAVLAPLNENSRIAYAASDVTMLAWCDRGRFRQVVRNLTANALRHGGDRIQIGARCTGDEVVVEVSDNGSGIPEADRDRIFEPYEHVGSTPGTPASIGLGLTVARKLARLMDGDLVYQKRPQGSAFVLSVPAGDVPTRSTG